MDSIELAKKIRIASLKMVNAVDSSHIGGALSMADILAVLYSGVLKFDPKNPKWEERDRLLLSKGHTCMALYAALAYTGFYPVEELKTFGINGSPMLTHISHHIPGVETSSGSLGHGLPIACGIALAGKRKGEDYNTFVICGDGEMDEGSNWEAIMFAPQHQLSHLCLIIDCNKMQALGDTKDVMNLEPLTDKMKAFRWNVIRIDGNDHDQLKEAFKQFNENANTDKPTVIIADTIKGKGVSYMEHNLKWHYSSPNDELLQQAIEEIEK